MKKISLAGFCIATVLTASAQTSLVKEVEHNLKGKVTTYPEQIKALQPAFTNAETEKSAYPYYVAGKYGYDYFDNQQVMSAAGQEINKKAVAQSVLDSYNYLVKALSLDTITDAKGKVKTKYSKDIIKMLNNHYGDFNYAAIYFWEAQDFNGAYEAWDYAFTAPENPVLGSNAPKMLPDSIMNVYAFNQGLAAYNMQDWEKTLKAFDRSIKHGNTQKNVYDYAIAAAYNYPDSLRAAVMAKYAEMAYPLYGDEDDNYIGYIVNAKLQAGQLAEAEAYLKDVIAKKPQNGQLYYVLGVLYENKSEEMPTQELAFEQFKKCIELEPQNAPAYMQMGYITSKKADILNEEFGSLSNEEYAKKRETVLNPILIEAAGYLEKSYELDPDNGASALAILRNIYYGLNDAKNLERIERLQKQ